MAVPDVTFKRIDELVSLRGKVAVITGGARGIGLATAHRLAEAGADLIVADIDKDAAEHAAEDLVALYGHRAIGAALDVRDELETIAIADRAVVELGGLDIWVNNAGVYPATPVFEMTEQQWDQVIDINLKGTFLGAREAAKRMVAAGRPGVIVNLASTAGYRAAGGGVAHYVSSKHGVRGLTRALAVEYGAFGIRVLGIAPTLIETPGIEAGRAAFKAAGMGDLIDSFAGRLPLGRAGVGDDVARVILFCVSDLAAFMTGSTLPVDGGELAQ